MEVQRTLVKSPPELWAEVSDVEALTRHLAAFGEITITRVEPESTVAWEGEHASGTVELAASGWGTKVTLSARPAERADREPGPRPRWRFWTRPEAADPPPVAVDPQATEALLTQVLDTLGQAHHRPFQR